MNDKPNRTLRASSSPVAVVAGIGAKAALEALPGGTALFDLLKARRDEMSAGMRAESERRLDAFYTSMLDADRTLDEQQARALLDDADFHALLRACVADIEAEKVGAYAALARGIATGTVAQQNRRHFILSLRDLSAHELALLRKAFVARSHKLMPDQGSGVVEEREFVSPGQPGSFRSIHVSNLTSRGFVHDGRLSPLGAGFAQAVWRSHELTPESLGYLTWSGHNVAIINNEIGSPRVDQVAYALTEGLRRRRSKSSIVAVTRDTQPQVRLFATRAVLLVGDEGSRLADHIQALSALLAKIPTVALLATPTAAVPGGLNVLGVVSYEQSQHEAGLQEIARQLLQANDR